MTLQMMTHDFLISYGRNTVLREVLCKQECHGLDTHFAAGVTNKYGRSSEMESLWRETENGQGLRRGIPVEFGVG